MTAIVTHQPLTLQNSLAAFSLQAYERGSTSSIARRSLIVALLQLMQTQDFHRISITELTKTAGVSRMSYYRHYQDKREILQDYMRQIDGDLPYVDLSQTSTQQTFDFLVNLFDTLKKFEIATHILIAQGFEYLIVESFNHSKLMPVLTDDVPKQTLDSYNFQKIFATGMLSNAYLHWVKTGQTQSAKQLAYWLINAQWHTLFRPLHLPPSSSNLVKD